MPPRVASQQQIVLRLLATLRPHVAQDRALPVRFQRLLASHREFGARDRRLYRELVFSALRWWPWIEPWLDRDPDEAMGRIAWLAAELPATSAFRAAFCASRSALPDTVAARAAILGETTAPLPAWFEPQAPALFQSPEIEAVQRRAALWLRVQTDDPAPVMAEFFQHGWRIETTPALPDAWRLVSEGDVTASDAYREGRIEVQDLGSQLILARTPVEPGGVWLDLCAGAGGKTLQLARLLGPAGRVDAWDVRAAALDELRTRARRAGLPQVQVLTAAPRATAHREGNYDGVLVDAPCSGSGTWRRAPHLKWSTRPADVTAAARTQRELLHRGARLVRAGGLLVYATCSLSEQENAAVAAAFEAHDAPHGEFTRLASETLWPAALDTDGFFRAVWRRTK